MDIRQLKYFVAVAETLNFSRAASSLFVAQPTLSYQISELEKELNCELFLRNKRKVTLTPAGAHLLPLAQQMVENAQKMYAITKNPDIKEEIQPLNISLDRTEDNFESTGITKTIASFKNKHPEVPLELHQTEFGQCIEDLINDRTDLAFMVLRNNEMLPSQLIYKPVRRGRLMLVWPAGLKFTTAEEVCSNMDIILADDHPRGHARIESIMDSLGVRAKYLHADSISIAMIYVQAGKGAIMLPEHFLQQRNYKDINIMAIPSPIADLTHMLVWNKYNLNSSIQLFLNEQ